jgi:hypothetical protein
VLLILASATPMAAMTAVLLSCRYAARSQEPMSDEHGAPDRMATEGRWEGLSAEVARLERHRRSARSGAALHRRHLAAVLPADARR